MTFDLVKIMESKRALRSRLAARPIAEKLRMLDDLRERAVAIHAAAARQTAKAARECPEDNSL